MGKVDVRLPGKVEVKLPVLSGQGRCKARREPGGGRREVLGYRVESLGFDVLGFKLPGLRVLDSGFRVYA